VGLKYRRKSAKFGNKLRIPFLCKEQQLLPKTHVGLATQSGRMESALEISVDKKNQLMSLFVFFISLLIVSQHVSGNHVPIIRS